MPDTTGLSEEQIAWANRLAKAAGIRGIAVAAPAEDMEAKTDHYGKGFDATLKQDVHFEMDIALLNGKMVSREKWQEVADDRASKFDEAMDEVDRLRAEAGSQRSVAEAVKTCLPFIDAPQNNPEQAAIGSMLDEFANLKTAAQQGTSQDNSRAMAAKLFELERCISEWIDRRAGQHLPPPADAIALSDLFQAEHQQLIKQFIDNKWSPPPLNDEAHMTAEELKAAETIWKKILDPHDDSLRPVDSLTSDPELSNFVMVHEYKTFREAYGENSEQVREFLAFQEMRNLTPDQLTARHTPQEIDEMNAFIDRHGLMTEQKMKDAAEQTTAGLARLLGSPSGRELLGNITQTGKSVKFYPATSAGALPYEILDLSSHQTMATDDIDGDVEMFSRPGTDTFVGLPLGMRDSDHALRTADGNLLYAPAHITIGHELVHALHNARGVNRNALPMSEDEKKIWSNPEEYHTITGGDLSEQTLRNDYGLTADRFGHTDKEMATSLKAAALEQLEASAELKRLADGNERMKKAPVDVDKELAEGRGFGATCVSQMPDSLKLALYKDPSVKGPLPNGWSPTGLKLEQIKGIVADNLPFRMTMLGWKSYNLKYSGGPDQKLDFPESLKEITEARVHHPRSAPGRQYKALGGKAVIEDFVGFKAKTGVELGAWDPLDWRANLRTLITANKRVDAMISGIPFVAKHANDFGFSTKSPLKEKLKEIAFSFSLTLSDKGSEGAGPLFADSALARLDYSGEDTLEAQTAFLKKIDASLASSDAELRKGKLATQSMSLVARHQAAKALSDFKAQPHFQDVQNHIAQAMRLADSDGTLAEAAKHYAQALTQMLGLDAWLAQNTETPVAGAIRALYLDDVASDLVAHENYSKIHDIAGGLKETAAAELYQSGAGIEDILNNSLASDDFAQWLEESEGGMLLFQFYYMLYLRKTVEIADAAQGDALKKIGFKQETIVRLGRDAADVEALTTALAEAHALLNKRLPAFLEKKRAKI